MSAPKEPGKRFTGKRKTAVIKEIWKSRTMVTEVAHRHDLMPGEVEGWIDGATRHLGNGIRS